MGSRKKIHQQIGKAITDANRIVIITHKNPDGDAIGSSLGLYEMLLKLEKKPTFFCIDRVPESFYFLPNSEEVIHEFEAKQFDLAIMLDCGADYMAGIKETHGEIYGGIYPLINIDHHPSNESFGKWNLVDTDAASTTQILTNLFDVLNWKITPRIATCLLTGLYTDTGSLKHSNASAEVHRIASELMRKGARFKDIIRSVFKNNSVDVLRLWGRVMKRITKTPEDITISTVCEKDFAETHTSKPDLTGVIDYLNAVPDARFSLLLTEINGQVKGSLRTMRDDVDLTQIAGKLGGGGHKKASGFTIAGKLEFQTRFKIVGEEKEYENSIFQ